MKHKKIKIAALAIVTASLLGGILYSEFGAKKSYDYSDYYVESKPKKTTKENKDDKESSEKELSLSLLQKTNKDVVGILEFDNRVIYEPVVQAPDNDYYVRKNINKEYANAGIPFVSADGNIDSKNQMSLTLAFDHRVIDGVEAATILQEVKYFLENMEIANYELLKK